MPDVAAVQPVPVKAPARKISKPSVVKLAFTPNATLPSQTMLAISLFQAAIAIAFWFLSPSSILPSPVELVSAFKRLWFEEAFGREVVVSLVLNAEALLIAAFISLLLAYSTSMPFFRSVVQFIGNFRFLGLAGLSLIFTVYTSGGHSLKVSILVFSVTVYYVTTLARIIRDVPEEEKDYYRTLGMTKWQVVYATIIRGRAAEMWEALRQTSAMGWMMLSTVEGLSKTEGGVGALLLLSQRLRRLDEVYTIQLSLWLLGMAQDYSFSWLGTKFFPWASRSSKGGK